MVFFLRYPAKHTILSICIAIPAALSSSVIGGALGSLSVVVVVLVIAVTIFIFIKREKSKKKSLNV